MGLMLFCAGNIVDDDVTVNRIFLPIVPVDPVCGLQSAVCKCHTPINDGIDAFVQSLIRPVFGQETNYEFD